MQKEAKTTLNDQLTEIKDVHSLLGFLEQNRPLFELRIEQGGEHALIYSLLNKADSITSAAMRAESFVGPAFVAKNGGVVVINIYENDRGGREMVEALYFSQETGLLEQMLVYWEISTADRIVDPGLVGIFVQNDRFSIMAQQQAVANLYGFLHGYIWVLENPTEERGLPRQLD
jgi:hypothetical protein